MDTPILAPALPAKAAAAPGKAAEPAANPEQAALDFAEMLAQELAPAAAAEIPLEIPAMAVETTDTETTAPGELTADLSGLLPMDVLATLPQQAMPAAMAPPVATAPPVVTADGGSAARTPDVTAAISPAKTAGNGNFNPAAAAIQATEIAAAEKPVAAPQMTALPEPMANAWSVAPLAQQAPAATAAAAALPRVEIPVSQPGWSDAFSQRVLLMAGRQQPSAELHLNPPELGPVSITLTMDNDLANVFFSSPLVPVREAIENALPTLREALGQAGIQLGETGVSAESFRREPGNPEQSGTASRDGGSAASREAAQLAASRPITVRNGLVDTFA